MLPDMSNVVACFEQKLILQKTTKTNNEGLIATSSVSIPFRAVVQQDPAKLKEYNLTVSNVSGRNGFIFYVRSSIVNKINIDITDIIVYKNKNYKIVDQEYDYIDYGYAQYSAILEL